MFLNSEFFFDKFQFIIGGYLFTFLAASFFFSPVCDVVISLVFIIQPHLPCLHNNTVWLQENVCPWWTSPVLSLYLSLSEAFWKFFILVKWALTTLIYIFFFISGEGWSFAAEEKAFKPHVIFWSSIVGKTFVFFLISAFFFVNSIWLCVWLLDHGNKSPWSPYVFTIYWLKCPVCCLNFRVLLLKRVFTF